MLNIILLILIFLVVLAALAFSGRRRTSAKRSERAVEHISSKLGLNENRQLQLNRIKGEFMAERLEVKKMRDEIFEEAISQMKAAEIDQERLDSLIEKNQIRAKEIIQFLGIKLAEFHALLTPGQREKVVALMEERKQKESKWGWVHSKKSRHAWVR